MDYDSWKLRVPNNKGEPVQLNSKCKCGGFKYLADNFCDPCKKIWEKKFKKLN